jgi:YnbE-like lipoprotein
MILPSATETRARLRTTGIRLEPRPASDFAIMMVKRLAIPVLLPLLALSCTPTVRVEAPKDPITINLNIKLDADVRVRLEEAAKQEIENNPKIF